MKPFTVRARDAVTHVRGLGVGVATRAVLAHAWAVKSELELECPVAGRPAPPAARIPVAMVECDPLSFRGFEDELELSSGVEYGQALRRVLVCRAGIRGLHVAFAEDGSPVYAQWLLDADQRARLRSRLPGPWRLLGDGELIVEFAYTFTRHRGHGAMAAGMGNLVEIAASRGASVVYTYVRPDNIASLRGCAKVGFAPSRVVSTSYRLGFHRIRGVPVGPEAATQWEAATAPRPRADGQSGGR